MNLTRLAYTQHPRPPQRELRQKSAFDSEDCHIGQLENLYVDEDKNFQFVGVALRGLLGFGKKHHLVRVEAIAEEDPGAITLRVDQQTVESAPTLSNPHGVPDEGLQHVAREHCQG
jgi:hypothetical protein